MKLERSLEQWQNCVPEVIAAGSPAQIVIALRDARHDILAMSAALAAADVQWQPIETAPRSSRAIIVWCPERMNMYLVTYGTSGCWYYFGGLGPELAETPTHWRRLPPPPGEAKP